MKCYDVCSKNNSCCNKEECRYWVEYGEDLNCTILAVNKNGSMTLREVADRLNISFVRVKQIEDKAFTKLGVEKNKVKELKKFLINDNTY
jgi:peroxiredoxin